MRKNIHPKYYPEAKVTCTCGNTFTTGSTLPEISLEICSNCHPFYTGEMKLIDTQGRIEKFQARQQKAKQMAKTGKKKQKETKFREQPSTLKEMLQPAPQSEKEKSEN